MTEGVVFIVVCTATYALMFFAFTQAGKRKIHIPIMSGIAIFDVLVPFYLFLNREWYTRLIEREDILTFGVWMHIMAAIILYVLYVFQISTARKLIANRASDETRKEHHMQARGILWIRGIVIFTGAILYDPEYLK